MPGHLKKLSMQYSHSVFFDSCDIYSLQKFLFTGMDLRFSFSQCCTARMRAPQSCQASRVCPLRGRDRGRASSELPDPDEEAARRRTHIAMGNSDSGCACCGRRLALGALTGALSSSCFALAASASYDPKLFAETIRPARPGWYEELYAEAMNVGMKSYEKQMEGNKAQLFKSLGGKALDVLELGIGTGPNIKYYATKRPDLSIIGVDPNQHMEKYARAAASAAGLRDSQFKFVHAVGEALPIGSSTVDAVICTLVLCSVNDVAATLKEVKRVLRPGGSFLFIEHVAAPAGSSLRFWQDVLNPVQQFVSDGCHLNRNTLDDILHASFTVVNADNINVPSISLISPHIIGMAQA